jgi:hypothetical protein
VSDPRFVAFVATLAFVGVAVTLVGAAVAPPDPLTHLRWLAVAVAVTVPVAYLLAYRGGYRRLRETLRR